jgi:hypothetical protein
MVRCEPLDDATPMATTEKNERLVIATVSAPELL